MATTSSVSAVENRLPSVSNHSKLLTTTQKLMKLKRRLLSQLWYINYYSRINKLTLEKFASRLKQVNLASKTDIDNFAKKIDFNNQLQNFTSNKNELNELSKKVKAISTKGLTKKLMDKFSVLNGTK